MGDEEVGKLQGILEGTNDKIDVLTATVNDQSQKISNLTVSVAILKTTFENQALISGKHFELIDSRLHRDYTRLNDVEKKQDRKQSENNGVEKWKTGKSKIAKVIVGTLSAILALIISINQVWGIVQKAEQMPIPVAVERSVGGK